MSGDAYLHSPIRYVGGKGRMVSKLMKLVPQGGKPYCEPFCGGASLFFAREPAPVEVLNDLDGNVVNLFRCLQDRKTFEELRHRIMYTPYARAEFGRALEILKDENASNVDRAWAFFVAMNQGFGGKESKSIGDWGRAFVSSDGMADTTNKWLKRLSMLDAFHWRLMRVQIDNRDALEVIQYWDNPETVFYIDPPYHPDTRITKLYKHEPDAEYHKKLVEILLKIKGAATLSGYYNDVYLPLESAGWKRIEFKTACHVAGRVRSSKLRGKGNALKHAPRIECVWINPVAQQKLGLDKS